MKDPRDPYTSEMFPSPPRRGRPPKPDALSNAEKQKRYRDRKRAEREKRRDPAQPVTSRVLDVSGNLVAALKDRKT